MAIHDPLPVIPSAKSGRSRVAATGRRKIQQRDGRYLPVNILDSGCWPRLVRGVPNFKAAALLYRFELVYLDKPGVTIYG